MIPGAGPSDYDGFAGTLVFKISDFGLAREMEEDQDYASTACGTRIYMAAEAHGGKYTIFADMWSIGCILYELCMLTPPFTTTKYSKIFSGAIPLIDEQSDKGQDWKPLRKLCNYLFCSKNSLTPR